jgi:hypothetical protein
MCQIFDEIECKFLGEELKRALIVPVQVRNRCGVYNTFFFPFNTLDFIERGHKYR